MGQTVLDTLRNSSGRQAVLIGLVFLGIYLAFPTADYSYDAIGYVGFIHQAAYVGFPSAAWHEYHILYIPLGYAVAGLLVLAGFLPDILVLMQVANALFSVLTLVLFFRLLSEETGRSAPALVGTGLLAFSYSFWYYATDPEVYPVCLFFLLLTFRHGRRLVRGGTLKDSVLAGLFQGLAIGFHVVSVLFAPILFLGSLFSGENSQSRSRRLGSAALFLVLGLLVALVPYAVKYQVADGVTVLEGLAGRFRYATLQESAEGTRWFLGSGYNPWLEFKGVQRGFAPPPMEEAWSPAAGAFLLRSLVPALFLVPLYRFRRLWRQHRPSTFLLGSWLVVFFGFFTAYNAGSVKFVPFLLVPILYLFALAVAPFLRRDKTAIWVRAALWGLVILLASVNFAGLIHPGSRIANNEDFRKTGFIRENTSEGDLIVHFGMGENIKQKVYLPYFGAREELILDLQFRGNRREPGEILAGLERVIRSRFAAGRRVFVLSDVFEDRQLLSQFHQRHSLPPGTLEAFFGKFRPERRAAMSPTFSLYLLTRAR